MPMSSYHLLRTALNCVPHVKARNRLIREYIGRTHRQTRELEVTLFGDLKMTVDVAEYVGAKLFFNGEFERHVTDYFINNLKPGDTLFDIGTHIGLMSLVAARAVGPTGNVHSFEPGEKQRRLLLKNIDHNRFAQIKVNPIALSDHAGEGIFQSGPTENLGQSKVTDSGEGVRVQLLPLDQYVAQNNIQRIDAIKIDVEGAELRVFKGAAESIKRFKPRFIVYECVDEIAKDFGTSVAEINDYVVSLGYDLYRWGSFQGKLVKPDVFTRCHLDYFALPRS